MMTNLVAGIILFAFIFVTGVMVNLLSIPLHKILYAYEKRKYHLEDLDDDEENKAGY